MLDKKKREKSEDLIGWTSDDGLLEVVGIHDKTKSRNTRYKLICSKCSKDKELFPDGYFVCTKGHLKDGVKPCGCAKVPKWSKEQYLVLARRAAKDRFIVHCFSEQFHGQNTKINLECLVDGHKWIASIQSIVNGNTGCPRCAGNIKHTEEEALYNIKSICAMKDYVFVSFNSRYDNARSRFKYECPKHGTQETNYNNFVNNKRFCRYCANEIKGFYGYYPERKDEQDYLYVLDFDGQFMKVGRSFDVEDRISGLKYMSKIKKIGKLRVLTVTHQEIYDLEQELLKTLRPYFRYYCNWSTETLINEALLPLNEMLSKCKFKEVQFEGYP